MQIPGLDDEQIFGESMLEEIRRTAERRLQQIEPLIEEANRLRDVLEVLERRGTGASEMKPSAPALSEHRPQNVRRHQAARVQRPAGSGPTARRRAGSDGRAAKGSNKRTILQLAADRPGITASEISELTGMKRTVVASTVSRLKRYGELLDHETGGVCIPGAKPAPGDKQPPAANIQHKATPAVRTARPRRLTSIQQRRAA